MRRSLRRRRDEGRRIEWWEARGQSVVRVPGPADRVWNLLHDPRSSLATDPEVVDAWREPGTPVGLGEIQVMERVKDGNRARSRLQVTEYEEGRRAVYQAIDLEGAMSLVVEVGVAPVPDSTEVEVTHRSVFRLTADVHPAARDAWQAALQEKVDETMVYDDALVTYLSGPAPDLG